MRNFDLEHKIKVSKVQQMNNPVILMNPDDLKYFETKMMNEIINFTISSNPRYRGIPIKTKDIIERNQIIIYDDISFNW